MHILTNLDITNNKKQVLPKGWISDENDPDLTVEISSTTSVTSFHNCNYIGKVTEVMVRISNDDLNKLRTDSSFYTEFFRSILDFTKEAKFELPVYKNGLRVGSKPTNIKISLEGANITALRTEKGHFRDSWVTQLPGTHYGNYRQIEQGTLDVPQKLKNTLLKKFNMGNKELNYLPPAMEEILELLYQQPMKDRIIIEEVIGRLALKPTHVNEFSSKPKIGNGWDNLLKS